MTNKNIFQNKQKLGQWLRNNKYYIKPKITVAKKDFIDDLFDELFKNKLYRKLHLYKDALDCIVANLIYYGNINVPLTKPNSIYYSEYKWANQSIINNILKDLTENGYCHHWKGYMHKTNKKYSFSPKYFPTEKIMNNYLHIKPKKPEFFIMLYMKDANKIRVVKPYVETWFTKKMNRDITKINDLMQTATVRFKYRVTNTNYLYNPSFETNLKYFMKSNHIKLLPDQIPINKDMVWIDTNFGTRLYIDNEYEFEINKESLYVYRSFARGKWSFGGRFYTTVFQGIPSKWRGSLTINGEETKELDYAGHHIRMLYHKEGLDFDGEPYLYTKSDTENTDKRTVQKYIAMIAINASGKSQTINAVHNSIEDDIDNGKYKSEIPTINEIEKYYDAFLEYHRPIAKYISNDAGIKLQRKDSNIINEILLELAKHKIVALPIHDSVIVQKKFKYILKGEMTKQYYKLINKLPLIT